MPDTDNDNLLHERVKKIENEQQSFKRKVFDSLLIVFLLFDFVSIILIGYISIEVYRNMAQSEYRFHVRNAQMDSLFIRQDHILIKENDILFKFDSLQKK